MDIDIINILEVVFATCDRFDSRNPYINDTQFSLRDIVIYDIYNFIKTISKENEGERFDGFSQSYLHSSIDYENINLKLGGKISEQTKSLVYFCKADKILLNNVKTQSNQLLRQLFTIIGKYYLLNDHDKNDIDIDKFIKYITILNNYIRTEIANTVTKLDTKIIHMSNKRSAKIEAQAIKEEQHEMLNELIEQLNSLIGLSGVKEELNRIINLIKVTKKREERGIKIAPLSLHLVFSGNPGTGKTTVARLLARIYEKLGVLSKGQFNEVDRSNLVGGFVGQTAIKTQKVIEKSLGGILFIDEAYSLTYRKGENDFGQEAVDTILKAMEDHREDFIVIVAGYPDLMESFLDSNPGLRSRFNKHITFDDYTPNELYDIFELLCRNNDLSITDNCKDYLYNYFKDIYDNRNRQFANGRDVRNFFEKVYSKQADRLALLDDISNEELQTLIIDDLKI